VSVSISREHRVTISITPNMDRKIKLNEVKSLMINKKNDNLKKENDQSAIEKDYLSVIRDVIINLETKISNNVYIIESECICKNNLTKNESSSETTKTCQSAFKDDKYPDLYTPSTPESRRMKYNAKKTLKTIIEEGQQFLEENRNPIVKKLPQENSVVKAISKWNALTKDDASDKNPETNGIMKTKSPRALIPRIDLALIEKEHMPRKRVSQKMQKIMDKLGDFKICPSVELEPLSQKQEDETDEDIVNNNDGKSTLSCILPHESKIDACQNTSTIYNMEAEINSDNLTEEEILPYMDKTLNPVKHRSKKNRIPCCCN